MIERHRQSPFWYYRFQVNGEEKRGSTKIRRDAPNSRKLALEVAEEKKLIEMGKLGQRELLDRAVDSTIAKDGNLNADEIKKLAQEVYAKLSESLTVLAKVDPEGAKELRRNYSRDMIVDHGKTLLIVNGHRAWVGQQRRKVGGGRIQDRKSTWEDFCAWIGENYPKIKYLHELTPEVALEYAEALWKTNIVGSTFNGKIRILKGTIQDTRIKSGVVDNAFSYVHNAEEDNTTGKDAFTRGEVEALLKNADGEMRVICIMSLRTGLRMKDCVTMRWSNIDLHERVIMTMPSKTKKHGTKVEIPITDDLLEGLMTLSRKETYIFPAFQKRYEKARSNMSYSFTKLMKDSDVENITLQPKDGRGRAVPRVGFHSFRKRLITDMHESGSGKQLAQDIAGHRSEDVHAVYVKFGLDYKRDAFSALPEYGTGA